LPLRSVDQLFGSFVLDRLESDGEGNQHGPRVGEIPSAVPANISFEWEKSQPE